MLTSKDMTWGTTPCKADGTTGLIEDATHIRLTLGDQEPIVLDPDVAFKIATNLTSQLRNVGWEVRAVPRNSIAVQKLHSDAPGFDKVRGTVPQAEGGRRIDSL